MNEQLKLAIQERVSLGYDKERIVNELVQSGYTEQEAGQCFEMVISEKNNADAVLSETGNPQSSEINNRAPQTQNAEETAESVIQDQNIDTPPKPPLATPQAGELVGDKEASVSVAEEQSVLNQSNETVAESMPTPEGSLPKREKKSKTNLILAVVAFNLVFVLVIVTTVFGWHRGILSMFTDSELPYNEATLLPGIINSFIDKERMMLNAEMAILLEKPDQAVPAGLDDLFMQLGYLLDMTGTDLPKEAHLKANYGINYDRRNSDSLRFDIDFDLDFSYEPFAFKFGSSMKMIDDSLYVRINRMTPLFRSLLSDFGVELPIERWIFFGEADDLFDEFFMNSYGPMLYGPGSPNIEILSGHFSDRLFSEFSLDSFFSGLVGIYTDNTNDVGHFNSLTQRANIADLVLDSVADMFSEEEISEVEEILDILGKSWNKYPLIAFKERPYEDTDNGEEVYVYKVIPDVDNIEPFLRHILKLAKDSSVPIQDRERDDIEYFIEFELPAIIETFNEIEKYYDLRFHVRSDGSLQAVLLNVAVRSEIFDFPYQIRYMINMRYRDYDLPDIEAPADVYEKTFDEIMMSSLSAGFATEPALLHGTGSFLRDSARAYYTLNDFSYGGFCAEIFSNPNINNDNIYRCVDSISNFTVLATDPEHGYYCISDRIPLTGPTAGFRVFSASDSEQAWQSCLEDRV